VDYPLAACGEDDVYVVHLETKQILARTCTGVLHEYPNGNDNADHRRRIAPERVQRAQQRLLLVEPDPSIHNNDKETSAPLLQVQLQGSHLCEARTTGGVHVHRLSRSSSRSSRHEDSLTETPVTLVSQGVIPATRGQLVTALQMSSSALWVGTDEGRVELYRMEPERPLALRTRPDQCWNNLGGGGLITSLAVVGDLGDSMAVATTDAGSVHVLLRTATADDKNVVDQPPPQEPAISFTPPFVQPGIYPTCATVVAHKGDDDDDDQEHYSIVCGANDGSMSIHPLYMDHSDEDDDDNDGSIEIRLQACRKLERHFGPVQCLTSPAPGLLLSTTLDGTMRMTNVEEEEEDRSLYHITGYSSSTVGSVWSDGTRIVAANGAFQTLTVYDFAASVNADQNSRKDKQRREDWNNEDDNLSF